MLSIHSLAAELGSDPCFLLSNLEISRVAWKRGARANELVVEINLDPHCIGTPPFELNELDVDVVDAYALRETRSRRPLVPLSPGARDCFVPRSPGMYVGARIYAARSEGRL